MTRGLTLGISVLIGSLVIFMTANVLIYAQDFNPLDRACNGNTEAGVCQDAAQNTDPINGQNGVILAAANLLSIVGGIIAVIIIVISGMKMITSGGDGNSVKNNRNAIIYALVGVAVIILARTIVQLVAGRILAS